MKRKLMIYRELLMLCKKIQISNQIDRQIENQFPTIILNNKNRPKQKILTLR